MSRTLRVGEALLLLLVVVAGLVLVDHRAAGRAEQLSGDVSIAGSSVGSVITDPSPDPQLCWLLGVVAEGQGQARQVTDLEVSDGAGECATYAAQGARGERLQP